MLQKSEILKEKKFSAKKKSSLFLYIRNTGFDQSSPVQPNRGGKNLKKSGKISKKEEKNLIRKLGKYIFFAGEKNAILLGFPY